LAGRGLSAGERVLLGFPPGLDFLVGLFGCLYAGLVAVPAYPPRFHKPDPRLEGMVIDCQPAILLTSGGYEREFDRLAATSPRLGEVPRLNTATVPDTPSSTWQPRQPRTADVAFLQYTSGSTGMPKGVMVTHACVWHNLSEMKRIFGLNADTVVVSWLPVFHDMGLVGNILQGLHSGCTLYQLAPASFVQNPFLWLKLLSEKRALISGGPCFGYRHCLTRITPEQKRQLDLGSWKIAYVGAEPISAAVLDRFAATFAECGFRREAFFPCYGLAEASLMVTGSDKDAPPTMRRFAGTSLENRRPVPDDGGVSLVGSGRPLPGLEISLVDPLSRLPVSGEQIGEIWVSGPSVAAGYWNRPGDPAFGGDSGNGHAGACLRTGDLGFWHEGELFVTGRLNDLIIIRGRNYYPHDLEDALAKAIPELCDARAAAFASDAEDGPRLVIVQETPRGLPPDKLPEVARKIREVIADLFELEVHTAVFVKHGRIPRASSGKTRRKECCRLFEAGELEIMKQLTGADAGTHAPGPAAAEPSATHRSSEIKDWLVKRLARRLQTEPERIDPDKPFAAFGLDSLALLTLAADLEKWLGRTISPTFLYEAPTIKALARALGKHPGDDPQAATPAEDKAALARIAIVGIGCRFPQCHGPEEFWQLLSEGRCAVGELPPGRWPIQTSEVSKTSEAYQPVQRGGFLGDVQHFDAAFFGITPLEAFSIDPQHRLLLETAWEALEHAGLPPDGLGGRSVGVFVGISTNDYARLLLAHSGHADAYLGTGNALCMAAHRLSYHLDLQGPSLAVDTACSSSLVAVHLACQAIRNGECELALAGGVNLLLTPDISESLARAQMLSPTGLCKTFDASADGYVRGEGCGVVVLKPLQHALRDRDPILAVIDASAVNQDGRSNGITAPNGALQTKLIRRTLELANVSAEDIGYVEAHGTGTSLGDPIEFEALVGALGQGKEACALGAVKTNLGHLEAAAGIASLIKTVLQVYHGRLAPHLHLQRVNPLMPLEGSRFRIPARLEDWPAAGKPRRAGVSSFGFGGTNAHVIISQSPAAGWVRAETPERSALDRSVHLLSLSARTEPALNELALRYADWLAVRPDISLADVCATAACGRTHFSHRLAIQGTEVGAVVDSLRQWADGAQVSNVQVGCHSSDLAGRIGFLFTGQGAQYAGMGRVLFESCPVFRKHLQRCNQIVREMAGWSVLEMLKDEAELERTEVAQPALFALEYALAETWRAWGIEPAALAGHSLGEYVAACVAGVFDLEDALKVVLARGRGMQDCPAGAMLACFAPRDQVETELKAYEESLAIAAVNGPENAVVAGERHDLLSFQQHLRAHGIASRFLRADRAFHSRLIEPALTTLSSALQGLRFRSPRIPLLSNVTGQNFTRPPDADYWIRQARAPVQFARSIQAMHAAGITHFLEIGPDRVLAGLGPRCLPQGQGVWLTSLRQGRKEWTGIVASLGRLYVDGAAVSWGGFDAGHSRQRVALPTYAFQRQRYWLDAGQSAIANLQSQICNLPSPLEWIPLSHWKQRLDRSSAGFDRLPGGLAQAIAPAVQACQQDHALRQHADIRGPFDRLAGLYIQSALRELGWAPVVGETFHAAALAERLEIVPRYQQLFERLLCLGAEDGWCEKLAEGWKVLAGTSGDAPAACQQDLIREFPAFAGDLQLVHHCAGHLAEVLRGAVDPLEVLFGNEAAGRTTQLYENSPISRFYNDLLAKAVQALLTQVGGDRPIRILELGAGTGGTTAYLLPLLPSKNIEYVITDVSPLFLVQARERFQQYAFVQYLVLDLEKDPAGQGFADGQFDLIVAANVFHATADVRRSLQHARRLLAPAGLLVLQEGSGPRRFLDLIFGLTEGWWRFRDAGLRADYPLLAREKWTDLLREEGFVDVVARPETNEVLPDPDQSVILARLGSAEQWAKLDRDAEVSLSSIVPRPSPLTCAICCNPRGDERLAAGLEERLRQNGHTVIEIESHGDEQSGKANGTCHAARPNGVCHPVDVDGPLARLQAERRQGNFCVVSLGLPTQPVGRIGNPSCEQHSEQTVGRIGGPSCEQYSELGTWIVTSGSIPFLGGDKLPEALASFLARPSEKTWWIDLDPEQSLEKQTACLYEAICHHDGQTVVVYRGDQRYVLRRPAAGGQEDAGNETTSASVGASQCSGCASLDRVQLLAAPAAQKLALLEKFLFQELHEVAGLRLVAEDMDRPIQGLGLDSLMAIQLRNRLESRLGVSLSIVQFLRGLSLRQLIREILEELEAANGTPPHITAPASIGPNGAALATDKLDSLQESELDALLQTFLHPGEGTVKSVQ